MPTEEPQNEHWSPEQPKDWTGVFGEPVEVDSSPGVDSPAGDSAPAIAGGIVPLRPLRVTEVISFSWQVVKRNRRACFGVAGAGAAIVGTIELLVLVGLLRAYPESVSLGAAVNELLARGTSVTPDELTQVLANSIPNVGAALTGLVFLQIAAFLVAAILSQVVAASVIGKPISGGEAWRATRGKMVKLCLLLLASTLLIVSGFLLPLLMAGMATSALGSGGIGALALGLGAGLSLYLGVSIFIRLVLAPVVMSLESSNVFGTLKRSFSLIKGSSWRILWVYALGTLLANAVAFLVAFPFLLLAGDANVLSSRSVFFSTAGNMVSYLIVLTFVSVVLAVAYTELRVRKEDLARGLTKAKKSPLN